MHIIEAVSHSFQQIANAFEHASTASIQFSAVLEQYNLLRSCCQDELLYICECWIVIPCKEDLKSLSSKFYTFLYHFFQKMSPKLKNFSRVHLSFHWWGVMCEAVVTIWTSMLYGIMCIFTTQIWSDSGLQHLKGCWWNISLSSPHSLIQ